jgi:hypothetical protein
MIAITIINSIRLNPRSSRKRLSRVFIYCKEILRCSITKAGRLSFKSLDAFQGNFKRADLAVRRTRAKPAEPAADLKRTLAGRPVFLAKHGKSLQICRHLIFLSQNPTSWCILSDEHLINADDEQIDRNIRGLDVRTNSGRWSERNDRV